MTFPEYDEELYKDNAEQMSSSNLVVYAEDPLFYRHFFKPYTIIDPQGLSCDKVRERAIKTGNTNVIGIVDGDFNDSFEHNNLFKIDYYSIENMLLCNHDKLKSFKRDVISFVNQKNIKNIKKSKLSISFDDKGNCLHESTTIEKQFHDYVNEKITSSDYYVKYMDLKDVVNAYEKTNKSDHKSSLYIYVKIDDIFSSGEVNRLKSKIEEVENVNLIESFIDYFGNEIVC